MKDYYRKETLKRRKNLNEDEKKRKDQAIFNKIKKYIEDMQCVSIYVNRSDEVNTMKIIQYLFEKNKTVVVPKVNGSELKFYKIEDSNQLYPGNFGILEPLEIEEFFVDQIDGWIVPVVGFDKNKNRIGYGKGYYDRILCQSKKIKIGLAYDCQEVSEFEKEKHDVDLDVILTETQEIE